MPADGSVRSAGRYVRRVVDQELDELTAGLPAVALDGAKGVGKTTTSLQRAATVLALDDEDERSLLRADPGRLDRAEPPILLDEWQRYPASWDLARRRVDAGCAPGRFLLTGSAAPVAAPTHSGAGRIVRLRMRPLALAERGLAEPTVSLSAMLAGSRPTISGSTGTTVVDYTDEVVRSGLPALRDLSARLRYQQLEGYVTSIVERDFPEQGLVVRKPHVLRSWLTAYGAATATTASYQSILDAATAGESEKPAKSTTAAYRDVLEQLWLLDPLPGWVPAMRPLARLVTSPKHHLADPALAAHLLGLDAQALLQGRRPRVSVRRGALLGQLFESLVTLSVRTYAQAAQARVHHMRVRSGEREIDLVVEGPDHAVVAIEVKLAPAAREEDVANLLWLRERLGDDLVDAVVVTSGEHAYRRPDGIAVVPAVLLGP